MLALPVDLYIQENLKVKPDLFNAIWFMKRVKALFDNFVLGL